MLKKTFIWLASTLVFICLLTETTYRLLSMDTTEAMVSKNCVVLVFGWPTEEDGTLHPMQRFRVKAGVAAYHQQQCRQIIFSGGAAQNKYVEGQTMAAYARTLGVQKNAITVEPNAHTTWENLGCSAIYLETAERVFLVSDSLHAHRAKRYACRQNPSLCTKSIAAGANPPAALFGWKVLNAVHELIDWGRDALFYREPEDNDPICKAAASHPDHEAPRPDLLY
ncbi:MAG: YdcF family protein [Candidatus Electrothrix sp. AR1]|nr:YdcF family protein [Candidatus Electrothrix sp. AR1]